MPSCIGTRTLNHTAFLRGTAVRILFGHTAVTEFFKLVKIALDMARALQIADQKLELAKQQNGSLIETTAVQAKQIEEMKPKANYYDVVLNSAGLMPISTIAKDYGKSAVWLNKWLHEHGIQYKMGTVWLLYQKYADRGYVQSKTFTVLDSNGDSIAKPSTQWTQRGRLFIYEQLKKEGILPLIEQDDS